MRRMCVVIKQLPTRSYSFKGRREYTYRGEIGQLLDRVIKVTSLTIACLQMRGQEGCITTHYRSPAEPNHKEPSENPKRGTAY